MRCFPYNPELPYTRLSVKPGEYHFQKNLKDKILIISISILKENDLWGVEGIVKLSSTTNNEKWHKINLAPLATAESLWIGSWYEILEKSGVAENCSPEIKPEDLESLGNQTLLKVQAYANMLVISSDYKYEIS